MEVEGEAVAVKAVVVVRGREWMRFGVWISPVVKPSPKLQN